MNLRAQVSVEYLIIVGFVTFLILSIIGVAFVYASNISDKIVSYQVESYSQKILSSAETVFYAGEPSKATFTAYLPKGVLSIEIIPEGIIINVSTSSGVTRSLYESTVPIQGALTPSFGVKRILVSAGTNVVSISEAP